jgi:hypothetical protein
MTDLTTDPAPIRDPMTGKLFPGARLEGGGNPIAKLRYQYSKRFLDAVTPEEFDKARARLITDMDDPSPRVRQAARAEYFDRVLGKTSQPISVTGLGAEPVQVNVASIVAAIREEEPDQETQFRIARRILALGQQTEVHTSGSPDGNGTGA